MKLDVATLPREAIHGGFDLAEVALSMRAGIDELVRHGVVRPHASFGYAAGLPRRHAGPVPNWDDPTQLVWFVGGWGPELERYVANAVRKLRALFRTGKDTLELRINDPDAFQDIVASAEEDGSFEWGDFPFGGATFVHSGEIFIPMSVSCLREVEDDAVAKALGGMVGAQMLKVNNPEKYNA